jgi:hypothetical protein
MKRGRIWPVLFPDNVCLGNIAERLFPQGGFDPNLTGKKKKKKETHSCQGEKETATHSDLHGKEKKGGK